MQNGYICNFRGIPIVVSDDDNIDKIVLPRGFLNYVVQLEKDAGVGMGCYCYVEDLND